MADIHVTARELHDCGTYYSEVVSQNFLTVRMTAEYEGCNPNGFDSLLLFPLADLMNMLKDTTQAAFNLAQTKMVGLGEALTTAANTYGWAEVEAQDQAEKAGKSGGAHAI